MESSLAHAGGADEPDSEAPAGRYARTGQPRQILVDPVISRRKFDRELQQYATIAHDQRRLGWWMLESSFPEVLVAFASPQLQPAAVLFGVLLDFTNYDLWAPSLTIVDPFTREPIVAGEIPPQLRMGRRVPQMMQVPGLGNIQAEAEQHLLVAFSADELPFLCLPGIREYHEHPAHSGDDWMMHRSRGEGTLFFILEKIYQYGVEPIKGYQLGLHIAGFTRGQAPQ